MKLKMLLLAVFAAGFAASLALAGDGKKHDHGNGCSEAHVSGTVAAQSLAVVLDKESKRLGLAAGSTVTLALGGTGQTVRVNVEACLTGTGSATQLVVRGLELKVKAARTSTATTTSTGTTTGKKHEDEHGKDHRGATTTVATTTAATTTTARTTTAGTTTSH